MRRRFFVEQFEAGRAHLQGEDAEHLGRVLRAQPGQLYELSDGHQLWLAEIESASKKFIEFRLTEQLPATPSLLRSTLLLAIVKFDRFEWALEKATELGVSQIVPLIADRSERGLLAAAAKRAERWRKILHESAQQSRRLAPPELLQPRRLRECNAEERDIAIFFSERADAPSLRAALGDSTSAKRVTITIGPEGGWTDEEVATARQHGFREASLGQLILRTETAVVAALAAVNYALGEAP